MTEPMDIDAIVERAVLAERERWTEKVRELQDMLLDMILHRTPEQMREDAAREGIDMDRQGEICRQIFERAKLNALPTQGEA